MMRMSALIALSLTLTAGVALAQVEIPDDTATARKYAMPRPSVLPQAWQLKFEFTKPMRVVRNVPGRDKPVHYWYFLYTVSNPTDAEVEFLPRIQMLTDDLELVNAQIAVDKDLFEFIKRRHEDRAELLDYPVSITGRLLKGMENAKDSVAVFPLEEDPKFFRIIVAGVSGEQWSIQIPPAKPGGQPQKVVLEKARMITFQVPGKTPPDRLPPVVKVSDQWIMREAPERKQLELLIEKAIEGKTEEAIQVKDKPIGVPTRDDAAKAPEVPEAKEQAPAKQPEPKDNAADDNAVDTPPADEMEK
jgi:hypothetical protein